MQSKTLRKTIKTEKRTPKRPAGKLAKDGSFYNKTRSGIRQKQQLPTLEQASANMPVQLITASLYDGKKFLKQIEVLAGALTIRHRGMVFERSETRDVVGKKHASTRRGGVKFRRMEPVKEKNYLADYTYYELNRKVQAKLSGAY